MELTIDQSNLITVLINEKYNVEVVDLELIVSPENFNITSGEGIGQAGDSSVKEWYYGTISYNQVAAPEALGLKVIQGEDVLMSYDGSESSSGDQVSYSGVLFNQIEIGDVVPSSMNILFSGIKLAVPKIKYTCSFYTPAMGIDFLQQQLEVYKTLFEETMTEVEEANQGCEELGDLKLCVLANDKMHIAEGYQQKIECIEDALKQAEKAQAEAEKAAAEEAERLEREFEEREEAKREQAERDAAAREAQELIDFMEEHLVFCSDLSIEELFELKDETKNKITGLKVQVEEWATLIAQAEEERGEESAASYIAAYGWIPAIKNNENEIKFLEGKLESIDICEASREEEVRDFKRKKAEEEKAAARREKELASEKAFKEREEAEFDGDVPPPFVVEDGEGGEDEEEMA